MGTLDLRIVLSGPDPMRNEAAIRYAIAHKVMNVWSVCDGVHTPMSPRIMLHANDHSHGRDTFNVRWHPQECPASVGREPAGKRFLRHLQDSGEAS